ncbi:MAG TPA: hypothetical protein DIT03_08290 [Candidatus Accumulibacter sp.]|nr:hypothetical protein [Accumulibacter sp.]
MSAHGSLFNGINNSRARVPDRPRCEASGWSGRLNQRWLETLGERVRDAAAPTCRVPGVTALRLPVDSTHACGNGLRQQADGE